MQSNSCTLSDAVSIWLGVLNDQILKTHKKEIKLRFEAAVEDFFFVAFLADQNKLLDGKNIKQITNRIQIMHYNIFLALPQSYVTAAFNWLEDHYPKYVPILIKFRTKDAEIFPKYMFGKHMIEMSANKWWNAMAVNLNQQENPDLHEAFIWFAKLHSLPCSSASLERLFSTYGFVWSKTRNNLSCETAHKLVSAHRALNEK